MATFRKLPSGRWNVQVRRKGEKPVSKSFPSKALAEQWARSIESEIDKGLFVDRSEAESTSLGELIDRYLSEVTSSKKGEKQERYRLIFLKERLGHFIVASFQSKHLAAYRDKRIKEGISGTTVVHEINCLGHVLEVAIKDWGLPLASNPAKLIRKPPRTKGRTRRLKDCEWQSLMKQLKDNSKMYFLVQFALETGMRRGEMVSMKWENVNLKDQVIFLPDTKNGEARHVPLSSNAVSVLKGLLAASQDKSVDQGTSRVVTPFRSGSVFGLQPDSISQAFNRACQKAGIEDLRFHDLRHEATSRFFEKGLNMMEVSSITGHKTLQMLKRYTHLKATELAQKLG
jgi:integrase